MRTLLLFCFAAVLASCNSSGKKDPNKEMDDTARRRNPTVQTDIPITPVKINAADIPASIKVPGQVQEAWKWTDKLGENILILSRKAPYDDKDEFGQESYTAQVHALHYAKKETDADYVQVWVMNDEEKQCSLDLMCDFVPGSATVTDLDKNGIAETKIQYSLACRGDVSPALMHLNLYENGVKYALQGQMWVAYSPDLKYNVTESDVNLEKLPKLKDENEEYVRSMGRYESEKAFAGAPPEFIAFAKAEWLKYSKEKLGE